MTPAALTRKLDAIQASLDARLLTATEAARFLGVSRATFFRLRIPPTVRPSPRTPRWSKADLLKKGRS